MTDDHIAQTASTYNAIAQGYAQKIETMGPKQERLKFLSLLSPHSAILDIGCSAGRDSRFFAHKSMIVTGIDVSEKLLEIAKSNSPRSVKYLKQDMRHLSFPPLSFDGIWANASLLHLKREEVKPVLLSFYKLLRPAGILFIRVKEGTGENDIQEDLSSNQFRHFTYFTLTEFQILVRYCGFTLLEIYNSTGVIRKNLTWINCFVKKSV